MSDKLERIEQKKQQVGSRRHRKMKRYSDSFNEMFSFFYLVSRTGLIDFCGSRIDVEYEPEGKDAKLVFREFENGFYGQGQKITTRHPNVLRHVLMGKRGWGLWRQLWSEGIGEGAFTKHEILEEFKVRKISWPEPMMTEFENNIWKERKSRLDSIK